MSVVAGGGWYWLGAGPELSTDVVVVLRQSPVVHVADQEKVSVMHARGLVV